MGLAVGTLSEAPALLKSTAHLSRGFSGAQTASEVGLVSFPTVTLLLLAALPASTSRRKVLAELLQATPSHLFFVTTSYCWKWFPMK